MEQLDFKIDYFVEDLHDQQMHLLSEVEPGFSAGRDGASLNITSNSGIGIFKTFDEEDRPLYEMFLFVTDEQETYFARLFKQFSVKDPFTKEEIRNYIDRMNGASGEDTKSLCRNF